MIIISKNKRPPSFQGLFNLGISGFLKTILLLHYYSWDFAMGVLGSQLGKVNCFLDLLRNSNLSFLLFTSLMQCGAFLCLQIYFCCLPCRVPCPDGIKLQSLGNVRFRNWRREVGKMAIATTSSSKLSDHRKGHVAIGNTHTLSSITLTF